MTAVRLRGIKERAIHVFLAACALLSIVTTLGIIVTLVTESVPFFTTPVDDGHRVSILEYLFGVKWTPQFIPQSFGVLPLISATFLIGIGSLLISVPVGLCTAIFLSEYAPGWVRQFAKPILEVLAGIPSVVYGYFALYFITPNLLRSLNDGFGIFNAASAAIVVGIMTVPTISSLCDDAFRAVPRTLREAAYALSATKLEVSTRVVLPAAMSGVFAAVLLALARAVGETMAVTLAAGKMPQLTLDVRESMQTMTAYIADIASGDVPAGSVIYQTIFVVGLTLFLITLGINLVARLILRRFREVYE